MNTRKIKVKLVDRPATLLCSFFGTLLGERHADRDGKNIWGFMLRHTDKVYAMVRKKYSISDEWLILVSPRYIIADRW
jgi:hypothetical protein